MLSYQHAYHAGNFADVLKHTVLIKVLSYLKQKNKPLCYIDTHAGSGNYRLHGNEAQKTKEWENGIGRLWLRQDLPLGIADYVNTIRQFNPNGNLVHYPGSPLIARQLLGDKDRQFLYELHPAEFRYLNEAVRYDKRTKLYLADGLAESLGLLPPSEHRGIILVDPSYELKTDEQDVVEALKAMYRRFATGIYLLWYPVVKRKRSRFLARALQASGIKNIQVYELGVEPDNEDFGMTASGMYVINPPWTLQAEMQAILPWLVEILGESRQGNYRVEQLVPE